MSRLLLGLAGLGLVAGGCHQAERPAFLDKPSPHHVRVMCYNVNWDAIFPEDDPESHEYRRHCTAEQFVRVVKAVDPDVVCLQEINPERDPQQVGDILDRAIPLAGDQKWQTHIGRDNVIAARWPLLMLGSDTDPSTRRGQAMALIDLPDEAYRCDIYVINAHFKSAGGPENILRRQRHADAIIHWIGDMKSPGGQIDLPPETPIIVLGDLNVYDTDPNQHLTTLITGDIMDEQIYGADVAPDWDDTPVTDALPLHNAKRTETYTWRNDASSFNRGPLDRIIYTDSIISVDHAFVLNTAIMSKADLEAAGLQAGDVALDLSAGTFDHLPLVADFRVPRPE
jgi:endonuclease/exonuclease/phosphatase family metal-dependent hydrolase